MYVIDEIEDKSREALENFQCPNVVHLGIDTYQRLIKEMMPRMRYSASNPPSSGYNIVKVYTCAGELYINVCRTPKDFIQVDTNAILVILKKLGLRW